MPTTKCRTKHIQSRWGHCFHRDCFTCQCVKKTAYKRLIYYSILIARAKSSKIMLTELHSICSLCSFDFSCIAFWVDVRGVRHAVRPDIHINNESIPVWVLHEYTFGISHQQRAQQTQKIDWMTKWFKYCANAKYMAICLVISSINTRSHSDTHIFYTVLKAYNVTTSQRRDNISMPVTRLSFHFGPFSPQRMR